MNTAVSTTRPARVLIVTDNPDVPTELLEAVRRRADSGPAQFRVLIPNPAVAEAHLLHPERHEKASEAEAVLRRSLPSLQEAAGSPVIGSVSVRHDPYFAVEEILECEPVDEIVVDLHERGLSRHLHRDLPHRLHHFGLPVTDLAQRPALHSG
jgi:hypothetical protein